MILYIFQGGKVELRKIPVPYNRYSPLKENWMKIFTPLVEHLHLQVRFNLKTRNVEIKVKHKRQTLDFKTVQTTMLNLMKMAECSPDM